MSLSAIVQRGWEALGAGDVDTVVADYDENMTFFMPGQADRLEGRDGFRAALQGIAEVVPPGFEITGLRHMEGDGEVVTVVEWKSAKIASSQSAVSFRFEGETIVEERWFIDTEQWKGAF